MNSKTITCERCGETLDPKKAKWLELSQTDGNYYTTLPSDHISQGGFSFGTACAANQINETLKAIRGKKVTTQDVLNKYFKGERTMYFQSSDALSLVEGETSLTYAKTGVVELWFNGNNGSVCIIATTDGEKLEAVIKAIIY